MFAAGFRNGVEDGRNRTVLSLDESVCKAAPLEGYTLRAFQTSFRLSV